MKQRRSSIARSEVQNHLVRRAVGYWLYCLLVVFTITAVWSAGMARTNSSIELFSRAWSNVGISVIAALCLMPLMIRDLRWFSNRFVGPIERLRRGLKEMAAGNSIEPIRFREGDFWADVAEDFNLVRERLTERNELDQSLLNSQPLTRRPDDAIAAGDPVLNGDRR